MTAIYAIGNRFPVGIFPDEGVAVRWAEQMFPGEWIKKAVKVPPLPLASKTAQRNLKNVASILDRLDWSSDDEGSGAGDGEGVVLRPE